MTRIAGVVMVLSLGVVGAACGDDLENTFCDGSEEATAADASVPRCASPVPLYGLRSPCAPGYLVMYRDGVDASDETERLSELHGFRPEFIFEYAFPGFFAELGPELREALRCEASVLQISYDAVVYGTD